MKKDMEFLLWELDAVKFQKNLDDFVIKYKKKTAFIKYFKEHYCNHIEKWAYSRRARVGTNANIRLERWHRQLKYEEAGGTDIKRLDKAIQVVLKTVKKTYFQSYRHWMWHSH